MRPLSMLKAALALLAVGALSLGYMWLEPHWLQVKEYEIVDEDIPPEFAGRTIIFLSDIHRGPYFSQPRLERLVDRVNALAPDLIILGGDYVHRDGAYIEPCFAELGRLQASLGKYGVLGNHDHWEGAERSRRTMQAAGITLLDNRAEWVTAGAGRIRLGGVGDLWTDEQDLRPTEAGAAEEDFVLLVSHNPDYAESVRGSKIDLILSGHTHGGQVTLFGLWAPQVPSEYGQKYRSGLVATPYTRVLISNGIGTITPPLRFFARPQIVVIRLAPATAGPPSTE